MTEGSFNTDGSWNMKAFPDIKHRLIDALVSTRRRTPEKTPRDFATRIMSHPHRDTLLPMFDQHLLAVWLKAEKPHHWRFVPCATSAMVAIKYAGYGHVWWDQNDQCHPVKREQ